MNNTDFNFTIGANISGFQVGMANIRNSVSSTAAKIGAQFNQFNTSIGKLKSSFVETLAFTKISLDGIQSAFGFAAKVFAEPLRQFSRYEDAATRLAPLVGGLDTAKLLAKELRDEAANGTAPFEQLASIAARLASVFKNTSQIRKWTTAFHDLAAGTGMDVNELVGNFVRSKASGRFEAGFMDMFAQKGVNLFPELEKQTGKTSAELRKLAAEGKLAWSEVETAILAVSTGTGKFAGQAAALSNTFSGSVAKMKAQWEIFAAEIAKPVAESLTPILQKTGTLLRENTELAYGLPSGTAIAAAGAGLVGLTAKFSGFIAKCGAGLAGVAAAAKAIVAALLTATGISALAVAGAAFGATYVIGEAEAKSAKNEALTAATGRLAPALEAVKTAKSFEELDAALQNAETAWENYAAARDAAGIRGGLNREGYAETLNEFFEARNAELIKENRFRKQQADEQAAAEESKRLAQEQAAAAQAKKKQEETALAAKKALFDESKMRVEMLRAEIDGNEERIAQLKEQEKLEAEIAKWKQAGFDDATARRNAEGIFALEKEAAAKREQRKESPGASVANGEPLGTGVVQTTDARIGGGYALRIGGGESAISVAREQLSVLRSIARNTSASKPAAAANTVLA